MANNSNRQEEALNTANKLTKSLRANAVILGQVKNTWRDIQNIGKNVLNIVNDTVKAINVEKQLTEVGKKIKDTEENIRKISDHIDDITKKGEDLQSKFKTSDKNFIDAIKGNLSRRNASEALKYYRDFKGKFDEFAKLKETSSEKYKTAQVVEKKYGKQSPEYNDAIKKYIEASHAASAKQKELTGVYTQLYNFVLAKSKDPNVFAHFHRDFFSVFDDIIKNITQKSYANVLLNEEKNKLNELNSLFNELQKQFTLIKKLIKSEILGAVSPFINAMINYTLDLDRATAQYRKGMGVFSAESRKAEIQIRRLSTELAHMGTSTDDVARAQLELSSNLTGIVGLQDEIVSKTIQWNKQFNISYDTSAKFLKTLAGVSGTTIKAQTAMIGFAKEMANAAQVPLNQVMTDVANASDDVRIFMGQSEVSLIKAAVEARQLGVTMNDLASTAKSLLNFESSITAELRASALIGQHLDFNNARRLAFNRDTVGMMEEIKRLANQVDFNNLNVIQQEQFARAAGVSVEKLQTMMQREKDLNWIRINGTEQQKEQLRNLERMKAMRDEEAKDVAKRASKEIEMQANQERLNQLSATWAQMMREVVGPLVETIVLPLMQIATKILPPIIRFVGNVVPYLMKAGMYVGLIETKLAKVVSYTAKLSNVFRQIAGVMQIVRNITHASSQIVRPFLQVSKIVMSIGKGFLKWVPVIGWVFTIVEGLIHGIMHFEEISKAAGGGILGGLAAVGNEIMRAILGPFSFIWDYLVDNWMGKSPSKLGLGIVKGLKSVGGMIVDALISPFKIWYKLFTNIWGSVLNLISSVTPNWMKSIFGYGSNTAITTPVITEQKIESDLNLPENNKKPGELSYHEQFNKIIEYNKNNNEIINKLNETLTLLTELLADGNIGISIDGAKLNYALSNHKALFGDLGKMSKISN